MAGRVGLPRVARACLDVENDPDQGGGDGANCPPLDRLAEQLQAGLRDLRAWRPAVVE
jgi:hypothetical protein